MPSAPRALGRAAEPPGVAGACAAARAPPPPSAASASWASRANSPAVCWRSSGCLESARSTTGPSAGGRSGRASSSDGGGSLTWANIVPTFESRRNGETRVSA